MQPIDQKEYTVPVFEVGLWPYMKKEDLKQGRHLVYQY